LRRAIERGGVFLKQHNCRLTFREKEGPEVILRASSIEGQSVYFDGNNRKGENGTNRARQVLAENQSVGNSKGRKSKESRENFKITN